MRGSLTQRYKGTWSIILDQGYQVDPATGTTRRRQKWLTVRGTRRDAEARLAELVNDTNRGTFVQPHKRTLGAWLDEWVDKAIKPPARTLRAYETYRSVITKHLKPALGGIPLQQLKATDLKRYYTEQVAPPEPEAGKKKARALSPATLEQHHTIVHSALQAAVLEGLVQRNVAKLVVGKPHAPAGHQDVFTSRKRRHEPPLAPRNPPFGTNPGKNPAEDRCSATRATRSRNWSVSPGPGRPHCSSTGT